MMEDYYAKHHHQTENESETTSYVQQRQFVFAIDVKLYDISLFNCTLRCVLNVLMYTIRMYLSASLGPLVGLTECT